MKIVKIHKGFRGGTKEHFLVLFDEPYFEDEIQSLVEDWCNNEPSGSNYGFTCEWCFIENKDEINKVLNENINLIENQIKALENKKNKT